LERVLHREAALAALTVRLSVEQTTVVAVTESGAGCAEHFAVRRAEVASLYGGYQQRVNGSTQELVAHHLAFKQRICQHFFN